ncbi:MAG: hypothetical protein ABIE94_03525, partial [archaeon]
ALNFVIGRVYSDKHGGDQDIRDHLKVNRELYNTFSAITGDFQREYVETFLDVLHRIMQKLLVLGLPEKEALGKKLLSNYQKETVIDILKKNDKDPVEDYYKEAGEICTQLMKYIKQTYS